MQKKGRDSRFQLPDVFGPKNGLNHSSQFNKSRDRFRVLFEKIFHWVGSRNSFKKTPIVQRGLFVGPIRMPAHKYSSS
jgi:hypothetical protein